MRSILITVCVLMLSCTATVVSAQPDQEEDGTEVRTDLFKTLKDNGFRLSRTLTGPQRSEGATFGFSKDMGGDSVFTADFALAWRYPRSKEVARGFFVRPGASIEATLTSDREAQADDAWRFRGSLSSDSRHGTFAQHSTLSAKFEADQSFDTQKAMLELMFTPTIDPLLIGTRWPRFEPPASRPPLQIRWRPFLYVEGGDTLRRGDSAESGAILRVAPRVRVEVFLNFLQAVLPVQDVSLFLDNKMFWLPLEKGGRRSHNYFVGGLEVSFNQYVSLEFLYKKGEDAPRFRDVDKVTGGLAIKF